jgi:drug/metabolite transporter (DMT)-like permease
VNNGELIKAILVLLAVVGTVLSLVEWVAGLRFWRLLMGLLGVMIGAGVGFLAASLLVAVTRSSGGTNDTALAVFMLLMGAALGAALFAYAVGFATFVSAWLQFAGLVMVAFQGQLLFQLQHNFHDQAFGLLIAAAFVGVMAGVVVLVTRPHSIIVISSFSGASWIAASVVLLLYWTQINQRGDMPAEGNAFYWVLLVVLTAVGIAIQYLVTGRSVLQREAEKGSAMTPSEAGAIIGSPDESANKREGRDYRRPQPTIEARIFPDYRHLPSKYLPQDYRPPVEHSTGVAPNPSATDTDSGPRGTSTIEDDLRTLKRLREQNLITEAEFNEKKRHFLSKL